MLAYALRRSGRFDLAQEISEMDRSYKMGYYKIVNGNLLQYQNTHYKKEFYNTRVVGVFFWFFLNLKYTDCMKYNF